MTELTEKVARAMVSAQSNEWDKLDGGDQGYFLSLAEAATASLFEWLAEPSEEAQWAGWRSEAVFSARFGAGLTDPKACWKAMLNTLRKEALGE